MSKRREPRAAAVSSNVLSRISMAMICGIATAQSAAAQRPVVPLETRWPERIAVGMHTNGQLPPFTVEARRDGWVVLTFLSTRPEVDLMSSPTVRLLVEARDVRRWTTHVRQRMAPGADS